MKSKGDVVMSVLRSILLEDAAHAFASARGLERDYVRLSSCYKSRGLEFLTLDLPSMDGYLLQLLEDGNLPTSGLLLKSRSKADRRPRFLWDLWSRVCDKSGCLYQEPDSNAILFLRQIFCLGKKLALPCTPVRTEQARKEYHAIESSIIPPKLRWDEDALSDDRCSFATSWLSASAESQPDLLRDQDESPDRGFLQRLDFVSGVLVSELGLFNPLDGAGSRADKYRHGPGAVSDALSHAYKYDFPHWPRKLEVVFPYDWCGSESLQPESYPSISEPPSRLIAVPKTAKGPRLIASEPVAHQWCQQWVKNELVERFKTCRLGKFINTLDQTLSQELVRSSSIHRNLCTLDLSSASDRVTCRHVEALLAANRSLLELCHATRTRYVADDLGDVREFLRLKKFAAMGSALTFPIQSIFFLCVVLASCGASTTKDIDNLVGSVRVFGDDIIAPNSAFATIVSNLTALGLKVNTSKSFSKGYFRESCGLDSYRGENVTPIKPKTLWCTGPESYQALVDTSNNLHFAGFWYAAREVASIATLKAFRPRVVARDSGLTELKTFLSEVPAPPSRWNLHLQRYEFKTTMLISKQRRVAQSSSHALLEYFTLCERKPASERRIPEYLDYRENVIETGVTNNRTATLATRWVAL